MFSIHEHEQFGKFLEQTSEATQAKPRKITNWTDSMKSKLKKLYVKENRSIHAIARMIGGREYEIAEALERFGFAKESIKLNPRPHPMKGQKREEYVPKWARKQTEDAAQTVTLTATPYFGVTPEPAVPLNCTPSSTDPRMETLKHFLEKKKYFWEMHIKLRAKSNEKMTLDEQVQHDLDCAKTKEMLEWFESQYTAALKKLAASMTESDRWTGAK